ncbi:MAG: MMPL family transporter [Nocardioidaceae bacterium]
MLNRLLSIRGSIAVLVLALTLSGAAFIAFQSAIAPPRGDNLPADSESAQVAKVLASFPKTGTEPVILVAEGSAPLSAAQLNSFAELGKSLTVATPHPVTSADNRAVLLQVPITQSQDQGAIRDQVEALRKEIAANPIPGLTIKVTGGPAFGADISASFSGANLKLLLATIAVVALLLILTYRSPVLWLIPLTIVGLADQVAAVVTRQLAQTLSLHFDAGIVSVLVFGAGTNYAILLISRYREELARESNHRTALGQAWRASLTPIATSNLTIVLALGTLTLASLPQTRDLGIASAVGLVIALIAVIVVLPSALSLCGPRVFWPSLPRPNRPVGLTERSWSRFAGSILRRPALALASGLVILTALASTLTGLQVGLSQADSFRVPSESSAGLNVIAAHFPAGLVEPMDVIAPSRQADALKGSLNDAPNIAQSTLVSSHDGIDHWSVASDQAPGTQGADRVVTQLRERLESNGINASVGGAMARQADSGHAARADFWLVAPLVLLLSLVMLMILLRSVVAPVALVAINALSAAAAIGGGAILSKLILGVPAVDSQLPLLAFIFLVALGIDYSIFLSHRIKQESQGRGVKDGAIRGLATTGTVITSAGLVLAGVFLALGTLPLMILGQLGIIVALGVLVDTLVVRTIMVPALLVVLGELGSRTGQIVVAEEQGVELPV